MNGSARFNSDQAGDLRKMVYDQRDKNKNNSQRVHTLSILSGKGGVGKSNIAAALSCALADFGKRIVLLDADLGMANLDILCGVNAKYNLAHLIEGSRNLNEILMPLETSQKALRNHGDVMLLPGGVGIKEMADLDYDSMEHVFEALSELEELADYLIMDAGAGIHQGVLSFAHASDVTLLITTPEPTSVRDAYGVIKSLGTYAWQRLNGAGLMLVVNMAGSRREAQEVAERIRLASMQFLGNAPIYLGYVLKDNIIEKSVRNCKIFYRSDPDCAASICIRNLAGELLRLCEGTHIKREHVPENKQTGTLKAFFARLTRAFFADKNK